LFETLLSASNFPQTTQISPLADTSQLEKLLLE